MQRTGAGAAAAELLDAAIDEVKQHRQSLEELLQFLRDARKGLLTEAEVVQEALMWRQLVEAGWQAVPGGPAVERAVAELAPIPAGAAGELVAAAGSGAEAGAGPRAAVDRSPAPPAAPEWPPAELPHPGSVVLEPPGPEDDERALLLTAATAAVDGCTEVVWARLKGRGDVLVVAADEPEHQATVVQELSEALPASVFPDAVVVGRRADLVHPLVEQVVATGRRVSAL
jgi:hypothetical protein